MRLAGKSALITGSSSGIGRAVATAFAEAGCAKLIINCPEGDEPAAESIAAELRKLGTLSLVVTADVSLPADCKRLAAKAISFAGNLDILVNNAGIAHSHPVEELPVEVWDQVMAVHARGTYLMTQAIIPHMYERNEGRIINTVSQLAYKGAPALSAYTAAKGAVLSFSRSVALEIGDRNVRINCVAPGATLTPILDAVEPAVLDAIRGAIPVGRIADVSDVAPSYVFLASSDGDHFQGQCISPNGGDYFL
jgi:3-oxoacyl-[acyl-carrier protein] reductase